MEISLRHVHHNVTSGFLYFLYVLVFAAMFKWGLAHWHIPGLSELFLYVF